MPVQLPASTAARRRTAAPRRRPPARSSLLGARREALGHHPLGEQEQHDHRDGEDHRPGHQRGRRGLDALQLGDAQRDGPVVPVLDQEQQREQELVPGHHEDEQPGGRDGRHRERQRDAPDHPQPRAAVHLRRLLERPRHRLEVVAQHVHAHGHGLRDVDDDQHGQLPAQPEPREGHEQRDGQQDGREQVHGQEEHGDLAPPEELQPRDRVGAEDRGDQRHDDRRRGQQRGVEQEAREALAALVHRLEHALVGGHGQVAQRDEHLPRVLDHLRDLPHGQGDHVVEGEDADDEEERDPQRPQDPQRRHLDRVAARPLRRARGGRGGAHSQLLSAAEELHVDQEEDDQEGGHDHGHRRRAADVVARGRNEYTCVASTSVPAPPPVSR